MLNKQNKRIKHWKSVSESDNEVNGFRQQQMMSSWLEPIPQNTEAVQKSSTDVLG